MHFRAFPWRFNANHPEAVALPYGSKHFPGAASPIIAAACLL